MMNPYDHERVTNFLDIRLVDCFVKQNPNNRWLATPEVAAWVFQTNKPSVYQKDYAFKKMFSILGAMATVEVDASFLEKGKLDTPEGKVYGFRLKPHIAKSLSRFKAPTTEETINQAFNNQVAR